MSIHDVECCEQTHVHGEIVDAVNQMMPDEDELYDLAELFKVFGDSTRIRILFVLFEKNDIVPSNGSWDLCPPPDHTFLVIKRLPRRSNTCLDLFQSYSFFRSEMLVLFLFYFSDSRR